MSPSRQRGLQERDPVLVERLGNDVRLSPAGPLRGTVRLPGSKSLTNRYLLCTALADGTSRLAGVTLSDDVQAMLRGLRALGIDLSLIGDTTASGPPPGGEAAPVAAGGYVTIEVQGCRGQLPAVAADIDVGNAGTAMRFLTALATLGHGRYRLDGSPRMRQRPIGPLVGALQQLGAPVGYDAVEGFPPITMAARGLAGGEVRFDRPPSSQFISALLMVGPYAGGDVMIRIDGGLASRPYVEMTIAVMRSLGVELLAGDEFDRFIVPAAQRYQAREVVVEPDASAATYFWAAAALTGGQITALGLRADSLQGDVRFVEVLQRMGCVVRDTPEGLSVAAPPDGRLRGVDVDLNAMPDTAQTLAVVALFADGPTTIRNVGNLRIKETDRLTALETELRRLGAAVSTGSDGITISPPERLTPTAIETYDDHRMAMSFALAGLRVPGLVIREAACVAKSFPGFFDELAALSADGPAR